MMGHGWDEELIQDEIDTEENSFDFWIDKNGNYLRVSEMRAIHIKNIINRIDRKLFNGVWLDRYGYDWRSTFISELNSRGEPYNG